jgi:hypothetical protein
MLEEMKEAYDYTVKLRGLVPGPHKIWLANPALSRAIVPAGAYYQTEPSLTKAEIEIEIVTNIINGHWGAAYGNYEHEKIGIEQGHLAPEKVANLIAGLPVSFSDARQQIVDRPGKFGGPYLPDAMSSVASTLDTQSVRAMLEALIAGERSPKALADLAIGKMRAKRKELAEALNGKFEDHHGELARMILDQIDALTRQIDQLSARAGELIAQIPAAWGVDADGTTGPDAGRGPDAAVLPAVARLDEITGCGIISAQAIIAEIGLDMTVFGTPGRLVSWAKRCPQTRQSGKKNTAAPPGKGDPWLNGPPGRSPPPPPAPARSSASATAALRNGAASGKPRPPSPAPS